MGFDYGAARFIRVTETQVSRACPDEYKKLQKLREAAEDKADLLEIAAKAESYYYGSLEYALADYAADGLTLRDLRRARAALRKLLSAFRKKTSLVLRCSYVGEGLRGSDVNEEVVWHVGGYEEVSKAGRAFDRKYGQVSYTWFMDGG
jgi:hypothetical protein